jgi:type IV pilus assembly protein PilE
MKPARYSGFTLVEVMIVVAIVAILASIAYPSYQEQVRKSRRADCAGELQLLANALERSFTLNGTYPGAAPAPFAAGCPIDGGTKVYDFVVVPGAGNATFTVRADPIGPQAGDKCGTLTLTNLGVQDITGNDAGVTPQDCW